MIGLLPKALEIDGEFVEIDSDYRTALLVMHMYNDRALSLRTKHKLMLDMIYSVVNEDGEVVSTVPGNIEEAIDKATWFLNIGVESDDSDMSIKPRVIDYEQDEQMLFSAVNSVFSREVRAEKYMHWWTFYGLCQSIDESSLISHIVGIRSKLGKGKRLNKDERRFYKDNKKLVDISNAVSSSLSKSDAILRELENS